MEKISSIIWRLKMPDYGPPGWESSNVYFVGNEDEMLLIDAGYPTEESIESILEAWRKAGCPHIKAILVTHAHIDHIGAAGAVKRETGADIWAHCMEGDSLGEILPGEHIDKIIDEGDVIEITGVNIKALHMPGHTPGHLCFWDDTDGIIFTGDLIVENSFAIVIPPNGSMTEYMNSLHRMMNMPLKMILPGHGPPVADPISKIEEYITHRILREIQIMKALEYGPKTIPDMAEDIYADLHPVLRQAGRIQILAHLLKMETHGQVEKVTGEGTDAEYRSLVGKLPF